jgi:crotonobetainyl-CoA:carnitine CoA-transferase CaiB-like acyl-CoA transferase
MYACKDGRVAVAALEPHFAAALTKEAGLASSNTQAMFSKEAHAACSAFFASKTRKQLEAIGAAKDIPLYTLAP